MRSLVNNVAIKQKIAPAKYNIASEHMSFLCSYEQSYFISKPNICCWRLKEESGKKLRYVTIGLGLLSSSFSMFCKIVFKGE